MSNRTLRNQEGVIATIALMVMSAFVLAAITTSTVLASDELRMSGTEVQAEKTFYAAEAGINDALYKLHSSPLPVPYTLTVDGVGVAVNIVPDPNDGYRRIITSTATDPTGKVRTLEISVQTSTYAQSIEYAVFAGIGGFTMNNNTAIFGDIYSNGSIVGSTGNSPQGKICGSDIWTAGPTIEKVIVGPYASSNPPITCTKTGTVHAHAVSKSEVNSTVEYETIDQYTRDHTSAEIAKTGPVTKSLPVDDGKIAQWTGEVRDCFNAALPADRQEFSTTTISATPAQPWSKPTRVNGNLKIKGNGTTLTVISCLWVTGILEVENGASMVLSKNAYIQGTATWEQGSTTSLSASVGENDGMIIVDGKTTIENGVDIHGNAGNVHSSLLVLSSIHDTTNVAVDVANTSSGVLYYAPYSVVQAGNNAYLNSTLAYNVVMRPQSVVEYKSDLGFLTIPSPNPTPIAPISTSWKEK